MLFPQPPIGGKTIVEGYHVVAGILQRLDEKAAHVVVIFGEENLRHRSARLADGKSGELHPISTIAGKHGVNPGTICRHDLGSRPRAMDNGPSRAAPGEAADSPPGFGK